MGADILDTDAPLSAAGPVSPVLRRSASIRATALAVWLARVGLVAVLALLVASAIVPTARPGADSPLSGATGQSTGPGQTARAPARDDDIELYEAAIRRVAAGENYYHFIVAEQRGRDYPVRPGITVRLPTLAYLDAWLGPAGQVAAAIALMAGVIAAWWRKLGEHAPGRGRTRRLGAALAFVGASLGLNRHYFPLHELWAGGLIALSFGLHRMGGGRREGRWLGALLAAALALAIRELALPYVLLMATFALARGRRREAAAWIALVVLFLIGLAWHLSLVAPHVLPGDPASPSWLALRGLTGWLADVTQSSNLRWLPHYVAGPLVVAMTFGWLGWRDRASGLFGFLLSAGYALAFMIAGRWNNFYWGAVIAPVMFPGLAFAPRALKRGFAAARWGRNDAGFP